MDNGSDPRPRTAEQIAALPEGPLSGAGVHDYVDIEGTGGSYRLPFTMVSFYHDISYVDEAGIPWSLGRYADGRWFRMRQCSLNVQEEIEDERRKRSSEAISGGSGDG